LPQQQKNAVYTKGFVLFLRNKKSEVCFTVLLAYSLNCIVDVFFISLAILGAVCFKLYEGVEDLPEVGADLVVAVDQRGKATCGRGELTGRGGHSR